MTGTRPPGPAARPTALRAPFNVTAFRMLWAAQFASHIGSWLQIVGAQWVLTVAGAGAAVVALVQTVTSLPIAVLGLPSGVLADLVDRRRVLVTVQATSAAVTLGLAAVTFTGHLEPVVLLVGMALIGLCSALAFPLWQAGLPQILPRDNLPAAAMLNAMSFNLARVIGPSIAGFLLAFAGPGWVFLLNGLSFVATAVAAAVHHPPTERQPQRERVWSALRVGATYVRYSPFMRRLHLRVALFMFPASAFYALLPTVAHGNLHGDARVFGILLGASGVGGVVGGPIIARLRGLVGVNIIVCWGSVGFAVALLLTGWSPSTWLVVLACFLGGVSWMAVMSLMAASAQMGLPNWVRGRGLGAHITVLQGAQAIGSVLWGQLAGRTSVTTAMVVSGVVMAVGGVSAVFYGLIPVEGVDPSPSPPRPPLGGAERVDNEAGPVLVTVEYRVPADNHAAFLRALRPLERSRRRTGAHEWQVFVDVRDPDVVIEQYQVPTWGDFLLQRGGRQTGSDQVILRRVLDLADGEPSRRWMVAPVVRRRFRRMGSNSFAVAVAQLPLEGS